MLTESVPALRALLIGVLLAGLQGCGTLYLAQAARGQWHLLRERRPISTVLADPHTPDSLRERLTSVEEARDFAVRALHLPDNRSYRTYADIKRPYVVWNVVAAPEFSVEPKRWCFPIAGCVAYRGYFNEKRAREFAARLATDGYDVTVGGVPAYSTLGKLADPILSTMMRYGDGELAAIIFHELAHQLLYVEDDSEFNEAFATTVEDVGLERWLTLRDQPDRLREFRKEDADERAFVGLFVQGRVRLAQLYASGIDRVQMREQKARVMGELAAQVRALQHEQGDRDYEPWLEEGLNNAQLASIATYYECVPGFERLLAENDGDLLRFYAAARALAHESRRDRHASLCAADALHSTPTW
jgi:predicted aminopeptidase